MNDDALRLDNQICFRLYKTSRAITRLYQPILEELNITYPQYVTMLVMWENEQIDFKELCSRLDLKTGTMTPILKKLEILGFIFREKNPDDNRRIWVKLTDKGRELKKDALKVPETLVKYLDMNKEQYSKYKDLLDELGDILEQSEKRQKREDK